jgi:glutamine synthetase adenylyltransferase
MTMEARSSVLPQDEDLDLLARVTGFHDGASFSRHVQETMKQTRSQFLQMCSILSQTR